MTELARHVPLRPILRSSAKTSAGIEEIVADPLAHFDALRFWPTHPLDDGVQDGQADLYFGAAGTVWGLEYLARVGATRARVDFRPVLPRLFSAQAARLLDDLEETNLGPLWNQDLYGDVLPWLGAVHGYAGNMIPLLRGWEWLSETQQARIADAVPRTLAATACRSAIGATWRAIATREEPPALCQHCHGAPGMVTTFADVPFASPDLDTLLAEGAGLVWAAGPLAKGSHLCHGTGGNGYAFLKLHRRTKDVIWLERARAFAMTATEQCRDARATLGRGRFSLWTGDVGLAIYLWDCITTEPRFPTIEAF